MSDNIQRRQAVEAALQAFGSGSLAKNSAKLLNSLGYVSEKTTDLGGSVESLLGNIEQFKPELGTISRNKVKADRWKSCAFLFQLTNDEITSLAVGQASLGVDNKVARSQIESFVFLAIELLGESWSRTDLAAIVRELNRRFPMPAIVIFRHGELLSLAVIDRRANLKDAAKDVIDSRITVIKDVRIANPHRAHLDILAGLALENLGDKRRPTNFRELYEAWIEALSTQALNKRFYQELANWYFWALTQAQFPNDAPKDADGRDPLSLIRLITRIIFCWFLKEKGLLPDALFDPRKVATLLGDYNPTESTYYKAILQNLFFATLNQEMDKREFRKAGQNFMAHNLYRYRSLMQNPDEVLKLLAGIPFMNGGLFECLDKTLGTREKPAYIRIDGFSDRDDNPLKMPNELFFGEERIVDLSGVYGDNKFKSAKATGLIHILDRYKFTVAENTPIEEEVALDPELLGKVFENLLAAYNPETGATARKQTGSFYTPREIVNYMVDESLIASLKTKLEAAESQAKLGRVGTPLCPRGNETVPATITAWADDKPVCPPYDYNTEQRLRHLFAYNDQPHLFTAAEVEALIEAIDHLKILDPACGSGAFPMGVLHKLVFVLGKLDPGNRFWKARQLAKASEIEDATVRERVMDDIEQTFGANELDYGRKLYLIENCIYGVDIQPIAVQISKLRFFISLVVEQNINPQADNRGIRPLPNLETKFVAANTLIGINRPGQQLLRNLDIDVKEAELRNVRERHFLARTPTTKAKCREQDATLRAEIAELLKSDGWNTATACALAEWNPYDQNASADFFDLEWMFGLMDSFEVVIGNPPYIMILKEEFDAKYGSEYPLLSGKPDLYRLFTEKSVRLVGENGVLSFIIPNTLLAIPSAQRLRTFLTKNVSIQLIVDLTSPVFGTAAVNNIILQFKKKLPHLEIVKVGIADGENAINKLGDLTEVEQSKWLDNPKCEWTIHVSGDAEKIVEKMQLGMPCLSQIGAEMCLGMQVYHNSIHNPSQINTRYLHADSQRGHSWIREFSGRHAESFTIRTDKVVPFVDYSADAIYHKPEFRFFEGPRLILREIVGDRLVAGFTDESFAVNKSCYILRSDTLSEQDCKALLAILTSKCVAYWIRLKGDKAKQALFPRITMNTLKTIPIPKNWSTKSVMLSTIVDRVRKAKAESLSMDTSTLGSEIDALVYQLYGLTPEEIRVVEESAPSPSPRKQTTKEIESKP